MTLPFERARAVRHTEKFLMDLCDPKKTPRVPKRYRDQAKALLRHYPTLHDLEMVERAWHVVGITDMVECPFATKDDLFGELK
jgi:hypothetical protein